MIHSMTAFARVQQQTQTGTLCWEIRSVNHRYLDVSFRLPESLRFIEPHLRAAARDRLHRGKVECFLKYQPTHAENESMLINKGMVHALVDLGSQLSQSYPLANDLCVSHILTWPGVLEPNIMDTDALGQGAVALFQNALEQLVHARTTEGQALKAHIEGRLVLLGQEVASAQDLVAGLAAKTKDKLLTRLHAVALDVPEGRVEQEIALILARLDVREELDRLQTHIDAVQRTLDNDAIGGRRLDFLMQELNREANTLSAKSDSAEVTKCAVEMKVCIEQMREQIQNIE